MVGGATGGYWATGNWVMATLPSTSTNSAMTQAKMGRSMKKLAMGRSAQRLAAIAGDAAEPAAADAGGAAPACWRRWAATAPA